MGNLDIVGRLARAAGYTKPDAWAAGGFVPQKPLEVGVDRAAGPDVSAVHLVERGPAGVLEIRPLPMPEPVEVIAPRLIGLAGLAGSGKSTVAGFLVRQGYTRISFAGPLKAMMRAALREAGVDAGTIHRMVAGDLKEAPSPVLMGCSPREAMQTLGTEWGRECIGGDFWTRCALQKAEAILAAGGRVVIDDVRFLNEAAAICGPEAAHAAGLREVWRVEGRGGIPGGHVSETEMAKIQPDLVLENTGSLDALEARVLEAILG